MTQPTPDELQAELDAAKLRQQIAEANQKTAEANQKIAEADKTRKVAENAAADADDQANRDKAKAEADTRKAIAEANSAVAKTLTPKDPTLKPLEGTVTAEEKLGVGAEAAAYYLVIKAGKELAGEAAKKLEGDKEKVLILTDRDLAHSEWPVHLVKARVAAATAEVAALTSQLVSQLPAPATAAPEDQEGETQPAGFAPVLPLLAALPSIVGAAADVAGYFQSDFTMAGKSFDAKLDPLLAAVAGQFNGKAVIDGLHSISSTTTITDFSTMITELEQLRTARIRVETGIVPGLKTALETAKGQPDLDKQIADRKATVEGCVAAAKALEERVATLVTDLTSVPPGGDRSMLERAAIRAMLDQFRHVLFVSLSFVGGETQTRQRRFLYPIIRYVGTATISMTLAAREHGEVIWSDARAAMGTVTCKLQKDEPMGYKSVTLPP